MAAVSSVSIPQHVTPGRLGVEVSLTKDDLRVTIDKLKNAVQELARRR